MKRFNIRALAVILAILTCLSVLLTACSGNGEENDISEGTSEHLNGSESESQENSDSDTENQSYSESDSERVEESETEQTLPAAGEFSSSILEADRLKGDVNAYFDSSARDKLVVENSDVVINLGLSSEADGVLSVMNKNGGTFLNATANAIVKTTDGKKFYASNSTRASSANIYRMGYYMYDVHVFGNDFFASDDGIKNVRRLPISAINTVRQVEVLEGYSNVFAFKVTDTSDPRLYMEGVNLDTNRTKFIRFSIKSSAAAAGEIYICTDSMNGAFSGNMKVPFKIKNDGEFHEYVINLSSVPNYKGIIEDLRIDLGSQLGEIIEIKDISTFNVEEDIPPLQFDRGLYVYSDKVNQVMHLIATDVAENILEYGIEIKIPVDQVEAFITEDRAGIHTELDRIHWGSATYVGFDIKNVGVFGFIMINDEEYSGDFKVVSDGEYYTVYSYGYPAGGKVAKGEDIYLGHRLYFGDTHSFDELIYDAWCEHNPLTGDDITVITEGSSPTGRFYRYDGLRGAYKFDVRAGNWYNIHTNAQNMHYNVKTNIKGDGHDRKIYVYTSAVANGQTLECAVLMDSDQVLIPIPLEVCKNFAGDGEANEFLADEGYSEIYFPLVIGAEDDLTFTMSHLYQNWGKVPLKQIDSIQYYTPFYHLSCGVTETNCLRPYYDMNLPKTEGNIYCLPDFRAMSAPLWTESKGSRDPQHTNGGFHNFLEYVSDGIYNTTEFVDDHIISYGPTYAEITMDYITDDGKIKVSYTHIEMPQTDENRTFYVCTYEFLDDLTVTDAKKNFSFYSVSGRYVDYGKIGYLDENNEAKIVDNTLDGTAEYLLGDECPYFDCFKWVGGNPETKNDYVNVGCLIYTYDVQMGGESFDGGFMIYVDDGRVHLSLNADTLSFKKGDKISLNMILVPWGSQISDYTREDADWNVRQIRENTLLDPIKITARDGEVIESVYLPRIKSTNGKSAEFTLSGGENNVTVEVQGIDVICRPKVYELKDGEWIEYVISSKDTPDSRGNAHEYDGYMIRYDGDKTFSYSFVVDMNGDAERTFKVVCE